MTSGDLLIGTTMEEARRELEEDPEWLQAISTSATIRRKIYTVVAHGVRVTRANTASQAVAIVEIERQNHSPHPNLKIKRLTWPWVAEGKPVSSLHLDLTCPIATNRLLEEGLLEDLYVHTCKVFNRSARLTQCFQCQGYGHVARASQKGEKCAHCAGDHNTKDCHRADDQSKAKCTNCRQHGHATWMKVCPVCSMELERLQTIIMTTPTRFQAGHLPPVTHNTPAAAPRSILKRTRTERSPSADTTNSSNREDKEAGEGEGTPAPTSPRGTKQPHTIKHTWRHQL